MAYLTILALLVAVIAVSYAQDYPETKPTCGPYETKKFRCVKNTKVDDVITLTSNADSQVFFVARRFRSVCGWPATIPSETTKLSIDAGKTLDIAFKSATVGVGSYLIPMNFCMELVFSGCFVVVDGKPVGDKPCSAYFTAAPKNIEVPEVPSPKRQSSDSSSSSSGSKAKRPKMDKFIITTNATEKKAFDLQLAKTFYAGNIPFRRVGDKQFQRLFSMVRPGYKLPNKNDLGGRLLDEVNWELELEAKTTLGGETVCMAIDGYSDVSNNPVVCASITHGKNVYLVETFDTSGEPHTSENLTILALKAIKTAETKFGCKVRSFVSDNAANMLKMRRNLDQNDDVNVVTVGCSAHFLNLLAKDNNVADVKEQVVKVVKYFNHVQMAHYWYTQESRGERLTIPIDIRWNSLCECLERYYDNWAILSTVCDRHRDSTPLDIRKIVQNTGVKNAAFDLKKVLKPIAVALDKMQKGNLSIADGVEIWKDLVSDDGILKTRPDKRELFEGRYKQAVGAAHWLANVLHPGYMGKRLTEGEKEAAENFATEEKCLEELMLFEARSEPFKPRYFDVVIKSRDSDDATVKGVSPVDWWKRLSGKSEKLSTLAIQLPTANPSSASLERLFSTFGFVHSKVRNRLGIPKASKLVFCMKMLAESASEDDTDSD